MGYRPHGYEPSDAEIERDGCKAFGPARPPFKPTPADFKRAARDMTPDVPGELGALAAEVAAYWDDDDWYMMWVV